jgi:hypothetical protein
MTLDEVALAAHGGYLESLLWPADEVLLDTPALILGSERAGRACRGAGIPVPASPPGGGQLSGTDLCRAYDLEGDLLALGVLDRQAGWWQPVKVLRPCC